MKSIKPGRGPSMVSAISSIMMAVFGIIWTVVASEAGGFFALFGVVFIVIAIVSAVYSFRNATSKNRYSTFDITDSEEESDPLNEKFGGIIGNDTSDGFSDRETAYCPYCGARVQEDFEFCNKCGKKLPQ